MAGRRASREKEGKALDVDDSAGSRGITLTQDEDPSYHASNVPPGERSLPSPLAFIPQQAFTVDSVNTRRRARPGKLSDKSAKTANFFCVANVVAVLQVL